MGQIPVVILFALYLSCVFALPSEPKPYSTPACKQAADYIIESMNATANPCDNFYEYACGGWKHKKIPEHRSTTGPFEELNDKMVTDIRGLLDKSNIVNDGKTSASSVTYSVYIYQQCLALGKETTEHGLVVLKEAVKSILLDQVWEIGIKLTVHTKVHSWNKLYVRAVKALVAVGFDIDFTLPDPKNVSVNMFNLLPAQFAMGFQELQNLTANAKLVTAYKDYIRKSAKLFCGDKCRVTSGTQLESDIDDIVKLEAELSKNQLPLEKQRLPENLYNVMTIKEFMEKTKLDLINLSPQCIVYGRT